RAGDHLLHLLGLFVADVTKGVAQRRLLVAGGGATHIAGRTLPVERYAAKGAPELPIEVLALLISLGVGIGHIDADGVAIILRSGSVALCSRPVALELPDARADLQRRVRGDVRVEVPTRPDRRP